MKADIFEVEVEAVVYPGVTNGEMGDAYGKRLRKLVGEQLEVTSRDTAPIAVGAATVIPVTGLKAAHVIYSPLISEIGEKVIVENVRRCTRASLVAACVRKLPSIALPVIRPNSEDMYITETARAMLDELRGFRPEHALRVVLADRKAPVVEALMRTFDSVR
jgi:O-acetyl-ADP-ribose deacetylase (regulator of RNase III)